MRTTTAPHTKNTRDNTTARRSQQNEPTELPRLTTTVPKEYVHRASLAEVFLSSSEKTGENTFTLTGQWPRAHTFFNTPGGRSHNHLQAVETIRQTGIFLAHSEYGIPLGHHFVMRDISATTHTEHLTIGPTPSDLTIETTFTKERRNTTLGVNITIRRGPHTMATGNGHFTCISPAAYHRLRNTTPTTTHHHTTTHHPTNQTPTTFGRTHPNDLVLTPTDQPNTWLLTPDPTHPVMFDHTTDHIPGMVLLEAAHQATHTLHTPHTPTTTHTTNTFHQYTELHTPCYIKATKTPTPHPNQTTTHITGHQNGHQVFTTHLTHTHTPTNPTP
ncbi:ScbA/BarX family gamma-butyrolactone biosynthesis protein [Streptomyces sp. NPDC002911]